MDIRDLAAGTELYLPVEVAGGAVLASAIPTPTQGDGEVCGTAIESPCRSRRGSSSMKGANLAFPRFTTPGPVTRHLDGKGYEATTGIGPDLMQAARAAVSGMIDLLSRRYRHGAGRCLYAVQRLRRPADQRDRRSCRTGSCRFYFPRLVLRMIGERRCCGVDDLLELSAFSARTEHGHAVVDGDRPFGCRAAGPWGWSANPAAARA